MPGSIKSNKVNPFKSKGKGVEEEEEEGKVTKIKMIAIVNQTGRIKVVIRSL